MMILWRNWILGERRGFFYEGREEGEWVGLMVGVWRGEGRCVCVCLILWGFLWVFLCILILTGFWFLLYTSLNQSSFFSFLSLQIISLTFPTSLSLSFLFLKRQNPTIIEIVLSAQPHPLSLDQKNTSSFNSRLFSAPLRSTEFKVILSKKCHDDN